MSTMVITKGMATQEPHSDSSDKKITPEFVAEIQATIDHNPGQSLRSIDRNRGISEIFITVVVH